MADFDIPVPDSIDVPPEELMGDRIAELKGFMEQQIEIVDRGRSKMGEKLLAISDNDGMPDFYAARVALRQVFGAHDILDAYLDLSSEFDEAMTTVTLDSGLVTAGLFVITFLPEHEDRTNVQRFKFKIAA